MGVKDGKALSSSEDGVPGRRSGFREGSGRRKQGVLREREEAVGGV